MAAKTKGSPSDLTGMEWAAMEGLLPKPAQRARRKKADLREFINVLRYLVRSGCDWLIVPATWWGQAREPVLDCFRQAGGNHDADLLRRICEV